MYKVCKCYMQVVLVFIPDDIPVLKILFSTYSFLLTGNWNQILPSAKGRCVCMYVCLCLCMWVNFSYRR